MISPPVFGGFVTTNEPSGLQSIIGKPMFSLKHVENFFWETRWELNKWNKKDKGSLSLVNLASENVRQN